MSISYPATLKAVGGAKTGIAPVNLLDVLTVDGNLYYWSDRPCNAPIAVTGSIDADAQLPVAPEASQNVVWSYAQSADILASQPNVTISNVSNQTGQLMCTRAQSGETTGGEIQWSNFNVPVLPADGVIDAIYPVAIVKSLGSCPSTSTFGFPTTSEEEQLNLASIGSTIADIEAFTASITIGASAPGSFPVILAYSFLGLAIYYHTSTGGERGYTSAGDTGISGANYQPWLLQVPNFTFHRSLQTDMGSFVIQNLSGDTLSRDMEKILRASAMEGAFFVYRLWQPDAEASWIEVHGQLTVDDDGVNTVTLKAEQLINASQDDTPLENYCETCQIQWGGRRCGSTQSTECSYSMQTCQVVERIMVALNDYEKNFGEATANTALKVINRRRKI